MAYYSMEPDPDTDGYWQVSSEDGSEVIASGLTEREAYELVEEMNNG